MNSITQVVFWFYEKTFSVLAACLTCLSRLTQSPLSEFGVYTTAEVNLKQCSFDKDADAVVLLDEALSNYDDDWQLLTSRRIRIKILNQRAIDWGNISILFSSKDKFEFIRDIEGITYNAGENPSISYVNRKNVYTEKVTSYYSKIKFAFPNVKAGSIIEYRYLSVMKHYGGLENWYFQDQLPTLRSCYRLQVPPNVLFNYVIFKKPNYPITVLPKPDVGQIYFEMQNIPGLRFEPYMDAPKDYFHRVDFQLSGYTTAGGSK